MKSLKVGKVIYSLLKDYNVYPIIYTIESDTKFPFITYRRSGLIQNGNKDTYFTTVQIELTVYSNKYNSSVEYADKVADYLTSKRRLTIDDININTIELLDASEEYIEDGGVYVQNLIFNIEIEK